MPFYPFWSFGKNGKLRRVSLMFDSTHAHITAWVIALILFGAALVLHKGGNEKGRKMVQMILRIFYLLVLLTGILLFSKHQSYNPGLYGAKFLGGVIVIAMMEMILIRLAKNKGTGVFWAIFVIALAVTFILGVKLPLGWNWLA
jgi:hypothetical protein